MPIYEYQCDTCGKRSELLQKISEPPASECPECGGVGLRRLVSASAFHLKGSGWYATDFKNSKRDNATAVQEGGSTDKDANKNTKATVDKTAPSDKDV